MIYIFIFAFSGVLLYLSEYLKKIGNKHLAECTAIMMLLFVSIFAGIRSVDVGTDVSYYVVKHFEWAKMYDKKFVDFVKYMYSYEEVDFLYAVIQYLGANFFGNLHIVLFILSFITNTFVYLAIKEENKKISVPIAWIFYCLLFFNTSLNIVRQSCAIAIVFYIAILYSSKKISLKKFLLFGIFAALFHRTAILAIVVIGFFFFMLFKKKYNYILVFMTLIICMFPFFLTALGSVLSNVNFLPQRYNTYFETLNAEQSSVLLDAIVYAVPTALIAIYMRYKKRDMNHRYYLSIGLVCICAYLWTNLLMERISYYFIVFFSNSIPYAINVISAKRNARFIVTVVMLFWIGIIWFINIIVYRYGQTYPYSIGI